MQRSREAAEAAEQAEELARVARIVCGWPPGALDALRSLMASEARYSVKLRALLHQMPPGATYVADVWNRLPKAQSD